ncbi:cellulose biosynthesis cyclic di-GMP-binding regulatory protein BcsB [Paenibacillus sp. LHD-117]|uniref:cellulose biosynthesis cyclic di-GMP-binding regulatory protein BcsB n=1 Tax=Paenibacillus sp. LHD-117 TaxID=3071412 RepID=UPI0027DED86E|nr:cellulose biosynthesis cyclic di-GMP-binding regulatory protein BcsB [Paenibacillus sp. LHD-117]MDQ6421574.1 cellulose biosynthesis cyclic di-GMP-binding regulatory protein BcsB [Paenibacillus sp. LHD-117]
MRKAAWLAGIGLILQLLLPIGTDGANAERYSTALSAEDISLRGAMSWGQSYIQIPDYWTVEGAWLRLDYRATPLARMEQSSVTLLMNGTPFHSFRPERSENRTVSLRVPVPTRLLVPGSNALTIQGGVRTRDVEEGCVPEDYRDNWFQVLRSSAAEIDYSAKPLDGTIRDFYHRFAGMEAASLERRVVVVPDDAANAELEAAANAIAGFAKASASMEKPIPLESFSEESWKSLPFVVAVSLREHLSPELLNLIDEPMNGGEALIRLLKTNTGHMLLVTSDDPALLEKAGRLLVNQDLVSQLDRDTLSVTDETDVATPAVSVNRTFKLTEAGDKLVGAHHQFRTYFVSLPANRSIAESSKIRLDFRYAKNLDFNRSMLTVLIDDKPIGSKKLSEEWADGDSLTLPIPKNMNVTGNFSVTAAFDLVLKSDYCARNGEEMPWAYVGEDSAMQLNTLDRTDLLLDNYPYPFIRDGIFHKVAVVLPRDKDRNVLGAVSNLFSLLGQYAESNAGELRFYEDGDNPGAWKDRNVIAVGSYEENALIRDVNGDLFFRFTEDGRTFLPNEKKSIDPEYGSRLGTLQLLESPYGKGHGFLAVTGPGSESVYLASRLMASEAESWKIWGDAVLADKDGTVEPYRFKPEAEDGPERTLESVLEREDVLQFLTAAALVLVLVLMSLLLLARKYRRKRGGGNET